MSELAPNKALLDRLLRDSSASEREHYLALYESRDDAGKSNLLEQMCWKGFSDYDVKIEGNGLFFIFPGNIGYKVQKATVFGSDELAILGNVYFEGRNSLEAPRMWAIYKDLEKRFGYANDDYSTMPGEPGIRLIVFHEDPGVYIPPIRKLSI
jgi:hypothetical protein